MVLPSDDPRSAQSRTILLTSLLLIAFFLGIVISELAVFDGIMGFGSLLEENNHSARAEQTATHSRKQVETIGVAGAADNFTSSETKSLLAENRRMKKLLSQLSALAETPPNVSMGVVFGHVHVAKTGGTTLNGNLSMHFERVCGHKGYSYSAYQTNLRRGKPRIPPPEMQKIGFEDCDWISQESGWSFWKQFKFWDRPMELHLPCRDPIDHLLSLCNYRGMQINCADNLFKEAQKCLAYMDRFSMNLKSIPNIHLKCFDWRAGFNGMYSALIGNVLQRRKKEAEYVVWATNRPRNKKSECILNANQTVQEQVRTFLRGKHDYYQFCHLCMGSKDDLFRA